MKTKKCTGEGCTYEGSMYQSKPLLCKNCSMKYKSDQPKTYVKVASSKPIKPISDKQAERLKAYRVVRDQFMKNNPFCKVCGTPNDITLHHMRGRIGDNLTNTEYFVTLCVKHHQRAENEPNWAKEQGLSLSRLDI